ncbi:MAG TPA: tetratricopeptide repeat protein [Candidatus Saccharimonadales bacterium]|nr:tetratricopeptide repeat protein [Candidatus Saccharimonadales bacterium]
MSGIKDKKKLTLVAIWVALLLLGAVAAGAFVRWAILQFSDQAAIDSGVNELPANVAEAQNLLLEGKPGEANTYIDQSLADSNISNADKQMLLVQKGNIASDQGDTNGALALYLQAYEISPDFQTASKIGAQYQGLGDNEKAIEYYKKAIELNPDSNAMKEANNNTLRELITSLGGQP